MTALDLNADLIDVSDITDRVDELEAEQPLASDEDLAELDALKALLDDLRGNGGDHQWDGHWYPATLIADHYMESYLDDLIEDIGDMPRGLPVYLTVTVDYDALKMDYTTVEIDGNEYWYR